jgi:hypothetical protein
MEYRMSAGDRTFLGQFSRASSSKFGPLNSIYLSRSVEALREDDHFRKSRRVQGTSEVQNYRIKMIALAGGLDKEFKVRVGAKKKRG